MHTPAPVDCSVLFARSAVSYAVGRLHTRRAVTASSGLSSWVLRCRKRLAPPWLGKAVTLVLIIWTLLSGGPQLAAQESPRAGTRDPTVAPHRGEASEVRSPLRTRRQNRKQRLVELESRSQQLQQQLEIYRRQARFFVPPLEGSQLQELAAGELVRLRYRPDPEGPHQAIGLQWVDLPRRDLWIASQDAHFGGIDQTLEYRLSSQGEQPTLWFGFVDLPWPLKNRRWVVEVWDNLDLAASPDLDAWEHGWQLAPDAWTRAEELIRRGEIAGMTEERSSKALWTPVNRGAWLMIALPDGGTLLGFHATFEIGGSVPDRLVVANTLQGLEELFVGVVERARVLVRRHYSDVHQIILGGDGKPIPPYPTAQ